MPAAAAPQPPPAPAARSRRLKARLRLAGFQALVLAPVYGFLGYLLYTQVIRPVSAICYVVNGAATAATVRIDGHPYPVPAHGCSRIRIRGYQRQNSFLGPQGPVQSFGKGIFLINLGDQVRVTANPVLYYPESMARFVAHADAVTEAAQAEAGLFHDEVGLGQGIHGVDGDVEAHVYAFDASAPWTRDGKDEHPTYELRYVTGPGGRP